MVKIVFFLKNHLLHQDNFHALLLCHVTFVSYFNKCPNPDAKLANLLFFITLERQSQNVRYPTLSYIFIYFFFNNRYQNWLLKIGGRVV